jgi:hypothetical protein
VFNIPEIWVPDINLFTRGAYSKMSEFAKQTIKKGSGLKYDSKDDEGNLRTDAILLALDKHPILRETWENELSIDMKGYKSFVTITSDMELLSLPSNHNYID